MKALYYRAITRLGFLFILVVGAVALLKPTQAQAFTCFSDCEAAHMACLQSCNALPHKPVGGCVTFCEPSFSDCVASCQ